VLSRNNVTSIEKQGSDEMPELMKKLNQRKIRWIVREFEKGELSKYQIAKQQGISEVHAWRVLQRYKGVKRPRLLPCGRKPVPIPQDEIDIVSGIGKATGYGAVMIERILAENGVRMPHNRIHRILRAQGLAQEQPKKSRRRKWVRYERRHSNSLWHADWLDYEGRQIILYEDDASRLVTGHGEFSNATTTNSIQVFDSAILRWGIPKQLLTDHGIQFCSDDEKEFVFRNHVSSKGTEHILARVKHPQTNGKLERLVQTMKRLLRRGMTLDEAVKFYNEKRPHMSLENGHLRTPLQAFYEKSRGEA
ncbi:MAG: integrase core domain-containing protein, partial [Candidatus Micrarchaeota archaeon]